MVHAVSLCRSYESSWQFKIAKNILENPNASPETLNKVKDKLTEFNHVSDTLFQSLVRSRLLANKTYVDSPWETETDPEKIKLINMLSSRNSTRLTAVQSLKNFTRHTTYLQKKVADTSKVQSENALEQIDYNNINIASYETPSEGVVPMVNWLSSELDKLGSPAWEAAIMLFQSEYQGSLRNLINSAKTI
jgi:hypothetical protein